VPIYGSVQPDEANALIAEWKRAKMPTRKKRLLDRLIRAHLPLIRRLVRKAAVAERSTEDIEDLVQAGCMGFVTAIERFDPKRGCAISTYAAHWIRHEVQQATRAARPVKLPRIRMTNDERKAVLERLQANPEATADELGISEGTLAQVKHSIGLKFVSTETPKGERALGHVDAVSPMPSPTSNVDRTDAIRRMFAMCAMLSFGEVRAVRVTLGIERERSQLHPVRCDQRFWPWRDRVPDAFSMERCMLSAAARIDSLG